jgi:cyclopropane fatty-acyl-phospholipid synthase-like methyltransferase
MSEISKTGFWNGETAHHHHVHSEQLSEWICNFIIEQEIETITDFGCGLGQYCDDIESQTMCQAIGVEGSKPKEAVFNTIHEFDLTKDLSINFGFSSDLAISLEVGEHIPKEYMTTYLDNITHHANEYLITSWAVRGQDGFGHVNCLDNHEIIPEFEKRGFELMEKETEDARSVIEDKAHWFKNTLFVLKRI